MKDFIAHEGVAHDKNPPGRGSGRYAWGSGENSGQHSRDDFLAEVDRLRKLGMKDAEIALTLLGYKDQNGTKPYTSTDLRMRVAIEKKNQLAANRQRAIDLYNKYGNKSEVAREMGVSEGTVRNLLNDSLKDREDKYTSTANRLKEICDQKGIIDVGANTELTLGVTKSTLKTALQILQDEGYKIAYVKTPELTNQNTTTTTCLVPPNIEYKEAFDLSEYKIHSIVDFSPDEGKTWQTTKYPESIDSSRIFVRYGDEGGKDKDGVIELRKGVDDISLGDSLYAQVRIMVDDKAFMKGMAIYSDDVPEGYDIIYNTNKKTGTKVVPELGEDGCVMKSLKTIKEGEHAGEIDKNNPFGAAIKMDRNATEDSLTAGGQSYYIDQNGNKKMRVINKINEEGDWDSWSKTLASQFLSKQPLKLINQQLDYTVAEKKVQLEEIKNLTNPVVKKQLLENFAGRCDSNASDLSALGFKDQAFQVLLPIPTLKDNEVYAPKYKNGETVALIRFPHGGTFEIPILKVNNKSEAAKSVMENAKDAIGINQNVAERLSGADFDGDAAIVIPMTSNNLKIKSTEPLKELEGWDNKEGYKLPDSAPAIKNSTKQIQMGIVTNLITDMSVSDFSTSDIAKAVKHSMVVIDSEKHHLDYKQSYKDNDIAKLKAKYQGYTDQNDNERIGASTILSRAGSEAHIPLRKEITDKSKMTEEEQKKFDQGYIIYRDTGETKQKLVTDPSTMTQNELEKYNAGKKVWRETTELKTMKVNQMDTVEDAMTLVRDKTNQKEVAYANFANELKSIAREARAEARSIKPIKVDPVAKQTYAKEVESINQKVKEAGLNSYKERQARLIANARVSERFAANPEMDYEHKQRVRNTEMNNARAMVGASKPDASITDKEWEAIQSNAITTATLQKLIKATDQTQLVKLATPKVNRTVLSDAQIALAKSMKNSGMYTYADIAERLGVSSSYISQIV